MNNMVLHMGASGESVNYLNNILKDLEYKVSKNTSDFDIITKSSVEAFQNDNYLPVNGIVDIKTWSKLENLHTLRFPDSVIAMKKTNESTSFETANISITEISKKEIDQPLNLKSDSILETPITINEINKTVKNLEEEIEGQSDIIVERDTLIDTYDITKETCDNKASFGSNPTLRYGDTGHFVTILQSVLKNLLYYNGPISGEFDWQTEIAVKSFQDVNQLLSDGIVGRSTWYSLQNLVTAPINIV